MSAPVSVTETGPESVALSEAEIRRGFRPPFQTGAAG